LDCRTAAAPTSSHPLAQHLICTPSQPEAPTHTHTAAAPPSAPPTTPAHQIRYAPSAPCVTPKCHAPARSYVLRRTYYSHPAARLLLARGRPQHSPTGRDAAPRNSAATERSPPTEGARLPSTGCFHKRYAPRNVPPGPPHPPAPQRITPRNDVHAPKKGALRLTLAPPPLASPVHGPWGAARSTLPGAATWPQQRQQQPLTEPARAPPLHCLKEWPLGTFVRCRAAPDFYKLCVAGPPGGHSHTNISSACTNSLCQEAPHFNTNRALQPSNRQAGAGRAPPGAVAAVVLRLGWASDCPPWCARAADRGICQPAPARVSLPPNRRAPHPRRGPLPLLDPLPTLPPPPADSAARANHAPPGAPCVPQRHCLSTPSPCLTLAMQLACRPLWCQVGMKFTPRTAPQLSR
jgi:hypothetical protein